MANIDLSSLKIAGKPITMEDVDLSEMLSKIREDSPFFSMAGEIMEKLLLFSKINPDFLPEDSLLREFVG